MLPLPPSTKRERRKRNPDAPPKRPRLKSSTKPKPRGDGDPKAGVIKRNNRVQSQSPTTSEFLPQSDPPGHGGEGTTSRDMLPEELSLPPGEVEEERRILGEYRYIQDDEDDDEEEAEEGTIHVQLDLDEGGGEVDGQREESLPVEVEETGPDLGPPMEMEPNTFTFGNGHQIICYPVGNLISTEDGNTFYITTAPAQPNVVEGEGQPTAITVFNPFTEFIPIQNQPH